MNRNGRGLTGPASFALLLARLCNGKVGTQVPLETVTGEWKKMTAILGPYNAAHPTRAKTNGWVHSERRGFYHLLSSWEGALRAS